MKSTLYISVILVWITICNLNEARAQVITNLERAINGIQMSVAISNDIVAVGGSTKLVATIKNSAPDLAIFAGDPDLDMQVFLTDESGTVYDLSRFPHEFRPGGGPGAGLQPGESKSYTFPLTMTKNIPPGIYQIKTEIKMRFILENTNHTSTSHFPIIHSNTLTVKVIN
jgi:hypothetical protein